MLPALAPARRGRPSVVLGVAAKWPLSAAGGRTESVQYRAPKKVKRPRRGKMIRSASSGLVGTRRLGKGIRADIALSGP